ncbi:MAG: FAD-dependent oxidoreductase, partial [Planctomycetaceae bacterium]|nr:FAD-dependent oxidoreductase [Planctomycetaceae bacterium]
MQKLNYFVVLLVAMFFVPTIEAMPPIPDNGLVLHLDAGQAVETDSEGYVVRWNDLSPNKRTAIVPQGRSAPRHDSRRRSILFQNGTGLYIDEQIIPADMQNVSVFAVAEYNNAFSFSILGLRTGIVPLVQLDVDGNEKARWIVRDTKNQTISAEIPAVFGFNTLFGGIMKDTENGTTMSVFYHDQEKTVTDSRLNLPLFVRGLFIGCLGAPQFSWTGTISEILVYDRAVSVNEITQIKKYLFQKHQIQKNIPSFQDSWNVLNVPRYTSSVDQEISTDVCVVGAGSAGCAAAIIAAREGANVVLVERQELLGGTGTSAGVSGWEPGPGCSLARELFER